MSEQLCHREDELLDALGRGFVGAELETHTSICEACRELRVVAGALLDDRTETVNAAPVPAAGGVWWRMRIRHRREAEATARRSLLVGQAITLAVAIALVVMFFGPGIASGVRHAVDTIRLSTPLLLIVATWALVGPIAGWVAIRQK